MLNKLGSVAPFKMSSALQETESIVQLLLAGIISGSISIGYHAIESTYIQKYQPIESRSDVNVFGLKLVKAIKHTPKSSLLTCSFKTNTRSINSSKSHLPF
jgi:hypothetical protein